MTDEEFEKRIHEICDDVWNKKMGVDAAVNQILGVSTRQEFDEVNRRLDELERKVGWLSDKDLPDGLCR